MKRGIASILGALALTLGSCATAPAQGKAPEWIFTTPKPDAVNTYFVGSSSDPTGDVAAATNDAAADLMSSITQYIGVKVNVATSAEAKASLDSYSANIKSTVTSSSRNQVSGFSVKERFVQTDKKSKRVTVYVLAAYATADTRRKSLASPTLSGRGWRRSRARSARGPPCWTRTEATKRYVNSSRPPWPPPGPRSTTPMSISSVTSTRLEPPFRRSASIPRARSDTKASSGRISICRSRPKWSRARELPAPGVPGAVVLFKLPAQIRDAPRIRRLKAS